MKSDVVSAPGVSARAGEFAPRQAESFRDWRSAYRFRLRLTDLVCIIWAVSGAWVMWFGVSIRAVTRSESSLFVGIPYWAVSLGIIVAWFIAVGWSGSRDPKILGYGAEEYRRVVLGTLALFATIAILAFALRIDFARGYLLVALPLGVVTLITGRWYWRQWLTDARTHGREVFDCVVLGSSATVPDVVSHLRRTSATGFRIIGVLFTDRIIEVDDSEGFDIRLMTDSASAFAQLAEMGADTIIISGGEAVTAEFTRKLSWQVEESGQRLILVPSLIEVAGSRLHTRAVAGLPLMHLEAAELTGSARVLKRVFDVLGSACALIVLSPLFLGIAVAIRLDSPGPVLFVQERIGFGGTMFRMLKFRSMAVDAEQRLAEVARSQDAGNSVMFKAKDDPRVTRVGKTLRQLSLDELPQFVNVLAGTMSLVGPRPPLQTEVEKYEEWVHRRFKVKPGVTGIWQVSGRSELSWQDSVRLDLYYVENWSLLTDVYILIRTVRVVLARDGAY